jgi:tetratricopeptide (TPR) repeat protein
VGAIVLLLCTAAAADDARDCRDHKDLDLRIKSCSALLERDAKNAVAYHHRGMALQSKGELDRAIADYSKATELDPKYAPAFESRGRAYASKGDYVHAVADVTKAGELVPKKISTLAAGPAASPPQVAKTPVSKQKRVATAVGRAKKAVPKQAVTESNTEWSPPTNDSHN